MFRKISENAESDSDKTENGKIFLEFLDFFGDFFLSERYKRL